jgi:hypothetical protein
VLEKLCQYTQNRSYFEKIFDDFSDEIDFFLRGIVSDLFVQCSTCNGVETRLFVETLAEAYINNIGTRRSVEQSLLYRKYPENTNNTREREEFYYAPIRAAKYYNSFDGVYIVELPPECVSSHNRGSIEDLCQYIKEQYNTHFIVVIYTDDDCMGLYSRLALARNFLRVILPKPSIVQLHQFVTQITKDSVLTENALESKLHQYVDCMKISDFASVKKIYKFLKLNCREFSTDGITAEDRHLVELLLGSQDIAYTPNNVIGFKVG